MPTLVYFLHNTPTYSVEVASFISFPASYFLTVITMNCEQTCALAQEEAMKTLTLTLCRLLYKLPDG